MEQNYRPDGQDAAWRNLVLKQLETVSNDVANVKNELHAFQTQMHNFQLQVTRDLTRMEEVMLPKTVGSDVESLKEWRKGFDREWGEWKKDATDWRSKTDDKIKKHERYFTIIITVMLVLEMFLKYGHLLAPAARP